MTPSICHKPAPHLSAQTLFKFQCLRRQVHEQLGISINLASDSDFFEDILGVCESSDSPELHRAALELRKAISAGQSSYQRTLASNNLNQSDEPIGYTAQSLSFL